VPAPAPLIETINLLIYNPLGQVLRMELNPAELVSSEPMAGFPGEVAPGDMIPSTLVTSSQEELLFVFDSGRTVAMPVTHLPLADPESLDWQQAFLEEPRIKEELATLHPIAKMSLYESCIQTSRRGFVKKIKASFFASYLTENFIGTGVKLPADKTCSLTFSGKEDLFVMVSQDGYIFSMEANRLPTAIEEVVHLGISDHIVSTFMVNQKPSILFITQNGKAVLRDVSWLEPANSFKTKGQPLLSKERREAGIRLVGSAPVDEADWCAVLRSDGSLTVHKLSDLFATGSVSPGQPSTTILGFSTFRMPDSK
jgi:DNA gyrase/topoisomerase IV subunit A